VEQEFNTKQRLSALIANPGNIRPEDTAILQEFAGKYPYFQPLHLLLAKAVFDENKNNPELATAALYNNGQLLYEILHAKNLPGSHLNIISSASTEPALGNEPESLDETCIDEVPAEREVMAVADEQEIFDEISELNIGDFQNEEYIPPVSVPLEEQLQLSQEMLDPEFETLHTAEAPEEFERDEENDLVLENILSTDFFAFQDNFKVEDVLKEEAPKIEEYIEAPVQSPEEHVVSKYDDDRLPYTFLWWLAKTRKEHEQIFQPYAAPKRHAEVKQTNPRSSGQRSELQQQYVENIFHMQSVFGEEETEYKPDGFRRNSKGDEIIESFIKNEPQISPPKAELINNENKAKKSAEDHGELVSETLAKIYIEQMLYDKAIETYGKLSLMFPEKSRYFADLIQSIEKKI
jgi:hypothetical protein